MRRIWNLKRLRSNLLCLHIELYLWKKRPSDQLSASPSSCQVISENAPDAIPCEVGVWCEEEKKGKKGFRGICQIKMKNGEKRRDLSDALRRLAPLLGRSYRPWEGEWILAGTSRSLSRGLEGDDVLRKADERFGPCRYHRAFYSSALGESHSHFLRFLQPLHTIFSTPTAAVCSLWNEIQIDDESLRHVLIPFCLT